MRAISSQLVLVPVWAFILKAVYNNREELSRDAGAIAAFVLTREGVVGVCKAAGCVLLLLLCAAALAD